MMEKWKEKFPKNNRFYETQNGILYAEDVIDILKSMPDESVDILLTDPPYNISQEGAKLSRKNLKTKQHKRNSDINFDYGEWDRKEEAEYYLWTKAWFKEVVRVLKPKAWLYIFMSKERIGYFNNPLNGFFMQNGIKARNIIIWCKTNPTPSFRKMNYLSATELIVVGSKGASKLPNFLYQKDMKNYFLYPNSSSWKVTEHPNEKPVELLEWLIKTGSKKGDIVLDIFMGSGSTAIASERLNRKWIGIEKNEAYCEMAKRRLEKWKNQRRLI